MPPDPPPSARMWQPPQAYCENSWRPLARSTLAAGAAGAGAAAAPRRGAGAGAAGAGAGRLAVGDRGGRRSRRVGRGQRGRDHERRRRCGATQALAPAAGSGAGPRMRVLVGHRRDRGAGRQRRHRRAATLPRADPRAPSPDPGPVRVACRRKVPQRELLRRSNLRPCPSSFSSRSPQLFKPRRPAEVSRTYNAIGDVGRGEVAQLGLACLLGFGKMAGMDLLSLLTDPAAWARPADAGCPRGRARDRQPDLHRHPLQQAARAPAAKGAADRADSGAGHAHRPADADRLDRHAADPAVRPRHHRAAEGPYGGPTFETAFSGRDLILLAGGLFLLWKATKEIHHNMDPEEIRANCSTRPGGPPRSRSAAPSSQIIALDVVFSVDSILTAVGMTDDVPIMVAAVVITVGIMLVAADPLAQLHRPQSHARDAGAGLPGDDRPGPDRRRLRVSMSPRATSTRRWASRWRSSCSTSIRRNRRARAGATRPQRTQHERLPAGIGRRSGPARRSASLTSPRRRRAGSR